MFFRFMMIAAYCVATLSFLAFVFLVGGSWRGIEVSGACRLARRLVLRLARRLVRWRMCLASHGWGVRWSVLGLGWCLVVFALLSSGCQTGDTESGSELGQPEVWRFAIEEAVGSVQYEYADKFKERIEAATDNRVSVEIYPAGTLGTSTQVTEQLNMGVVQFAMASPGSLGKFIPELQVFLLHFLLSDDEEVNRRVLMDPQLLAGFGELYREKGLALLAFYAEGEMVWTTKREIREPSDFQGVKFRVMSTPLLLDTYRAYGASPTSMPYGEVYSGLQVNLIDAQVNPIFAIERQKFYEVTEWLIFPGHAHFVTSAAANLDFIESLSPERAALVTETIKELDREIFQVQVDLQTERLRDLLEASRRRGHTLHMVGGLDELRDWLSDEEQAELLDGNESLVIEPELSSAERAQFAELAGEVEARYLEIGGTDAARYLELVRDRVAVWEQRLSGGAGETKAGSEGVGE